MMRSIKQEPITKMAKSYGFVILMLLVSSPICHGQDYGAESQTITAPPREMGNCNGIFLMYTFENKAKEYPRVKNVTAQGWSFNSSAVIINAGTEDLLGWQMFIGFQHRELIVSASGGAPTDGDFPLDASNGTTFIGSDHPDLKTSIETANDFGQMSASMKISGSLFGVGRNSKPLPKKFTLVNDGWQCPAATRKGSKMYVCCKKNPKLKAKKKPKVKFSPRKNGDLNIVYDVIGSYGSSYLAQVTIDNNNPIGYLDHWNLTWEWMRGEIIYSMRGAFTSKIDQATCLYSRAGSYYNDIDFSKVMSCEKRPYISDLPVERRDDNVTGKLPYCCKNGTLLPAVMDPSKSRAMFQMQVYKLPPDTNKTALYPPQHWQIDGVLNAKYKCGTPIRVDPSSYPESTGLRATQYAIASWQVVCNITKPKPRAARCCVSFSAYYNDSAIPCNTCACGCDDIDTDTCNENGRQLLLPPSALLVPFDNRTVKAKAWAKQKHLPFPKKLPCPDNCGVSINWHLNSDFSDGWSARITVFNWENLPFVDWFVAIDMGKAAAGYEKVYSFNGTRVPPKNHTVIFQALRGMEYLVGLANGSDPRRDPPIPGKQQSVISFSKKHIKGLDIIKGDGFPKKILFNGAECALPNAIPKKSVAHGLKINVVMSVVLVALVTLMMTGDHLC